MIVSIKIKPRLMPSWLWRLIRPLWPKRDLKFDTLADIEKFMAQEFGGVYFPFGPPPTPAPVSEAIAMQNQAYDPGKSYKVSGCMRQKPSWFPGWLFRRRIGCKLFPWQPVEKIISSPNVVLTPRGEIYDLTDVSVTLLDTDAPAGDKEA